MIRVLVLLLLLPMPVTFLNAQLGFSHEIGAFVGGVAFQSDFGQRHDFITNSSNTGFSAGVVHYLNFAYRSECNCYSSDTYWNDHFKIRSEVAYNQTNLEHYGEWVADDKTSLVAYQLRAMKGVAKVTDLGFQLEYFPFSIREFTATDGSWGPFAAIGAHYCFYNNGTYSDLGPIGSPVSTPVKYLGATQSERGNTWSIVGSLGTRYKLSELSDLFVELRWQYYDSDWVDGLNPDPEIYLENKANDWNLWFNFGYIYYLE